MYNCIVVDDDVFAISHLRRLINDRIDLKLERIFTNASEALEFLATNTIDFIFLDIYMPGMMGTNVAKLLKGKYPIIFTTSSQQYALEAFDLQAIDYLLKPINTDRFNQAIDKIKLLLQQKDLKVSDASNTDSRKPITIIADRKMYKILPSEIYYIESQLEYVCYHTIKIKLLSLGALKDVIDILPADDFVRIQKSHIINLRHLHSYTATAVTLSNGVELPIGRVYKDHFKEVVSRNFI